MKPQRIQTGATPAMYVPRQFREDRTDTLARAVRSIQLAALVTPGPDGLQVSHVPMVLHEDAAGTWTLQTHVARPNPHWSLAGAASVAIFQGPQAYVSPSWYPAKREHGKVVPTWNYIAVHAHGTLETMDDGPALLSHLNNLTDANEAGRDQPWHVADAPADYVGALSRAIVGLRLRVSRIEGAWKMIQHRTAADRLGTIAGLASDPHGQAVAEIMQGLEAARTIPG